MDSLLEPEDALFAQRALAAPWGELGRSWTLGVVSLLSKFWLHVLNDFRVEEGLDTFYQHTMAREEGQGLITVCNHTRCGRHSLRGQQQEPGPRGDCRWAHSVVGNDERPICIPLPSCSTADDPAVFCAMLPTSFFFTEHRHLGNRWSLCAKASGLFGQPHCVAVLRLRSGCAALQQVSCASVTPAWRHEMPEHQRLAWLNMPTCCRRSATATCYWAPSSKAARRCPSRCAPATPLCSGECCTDCQHVMPTAACCMGGCIVYAWPAPVCCTQQHLPPFPNSSAAPAPTSLSCGRWRRRWRVAAGCTSSLRARQAVGRGRLWGLNVPSMPTRVPFDETLLQL